MATDGEATRPRAAEIPLANVRTSDPCPTRRVRDHRLLASLFEKGDLGVSKDGPYKPEHYRY